MGHFSGLVWSYVLDGQGGAQQVSWEEWSERKTSPGILWIHLDRTGADAQAWLREKSGLEVIVTEALLAEESRPRYFVTGEGLLVNLRGVNLNPGADPEDMVSLRLWIEPTRIITVRHRPLMAARGIQDRLEQRGGPKTSGDFLAMVADQLIARMGPVINELEDAADELEDQMVEQASSGLRGSLGALRREAIALRRYIAPQREVMSRLQQEPLSWIGPEHKLRLRETTDHLLRYLEDLDAARERIAVMQEELTNRLAEQLNRTMYIIALVTVIFLPLSLLTGLLGINVAGIPGAENHWAFITVCSVLVILAFGQVVIFRRLKWV
ncbi:zinc transporter ZntB [Candidatus Nitronereus thalassa]|uniref:Zinc transporter ZntB n=1 Tax=Candidatus Nitronereus thalassa TaxID=3020898 RepID=A0ABU3K5R4_9BACT|nr:zinc transporter ZntB [Candidatus Nitronereus thalassa]MDT7041749.1 zinc transporter ZntB [Candidatus Nitronereus thalassa]